MRWTIIHSDAALDQHGRELLHRAVEKALGKYGAPEIFNSDQGSQFTSMAFTGLLRDNSIAISMDGRGVWRDTVFVERLWRYIKYEEVYLRAVTSSRTREPQFANIWPSTTAGARTRALTG